MTTIPSTDPTVYLATDLITEAFDLCGIGSEGEALSDDMFVRARRSLNLIVRTWNGADHLWTRTEDAVTLVANQASYALETLYGVKPMRILSVRRKVTSGSLETPLMEYSRQEYFDTPNKTTASVPTAFYYDPQAETGTLYLWPTASTATAAAQTLAITSLRRMTEFSATNSEADMPIEWAQALTYALAEQLALKYGVARDVRAEIAVRAASLYADIKGWDNEPASVFLQPDLRW